MTDDPEKKLVLSFGEALWDVFPDDLYPGGAPLNVAYHLAKLGYRAAPVTAIGNDALGNRLLQKMRDWHLDIGFVTQTEHRLTGLVKVTLKPGGQAVYEIQEGAAWDWIALSDHQHKAARNAAAVVFGTLALRANRNRIQLSKLLSQCSGALKLYDVNLRPPYTRNELVWEIAKSADVIKLNLDELKTLLPANKHDAGHESMARQFAGMTSCETICVTAGADGAGLLHNSVWHWSDGPTVKVTDTVGAGDAFVAGLVDGLLTNAKPQEILAKACRLGELVASQPGATPAYEIDGLMVDSQSA